MGKIRLDIKSTTCLGTLGIVDIVLNNTKLAAYKELTSNVQSLEYDADILTASDNVLKIALLNDQAHDANLDGDYSDAEDEVVKIIVSAISISTDNVNFTSILPQNELSHTVPSGIHAGETEIFRSSITQFISFGPDYQLKFDTQGLLNSDYLQGFYFRLIDGVYYDANGNVVPN